MNEIKVAIRTLCTHLNFLRGTHIKAEHFRLAKFNKTDDNVIPVFWDTIQKCVNNCRDKSADIKSYLRSLNYDNEKFYFLCENYGEGSRELLITLTFIICKKLDDWVINELENSPFSDKFKMIESRLDESNLSQCDPPRLNKNSYQNYLEWVKGKIALNVKIAEDYKEQIGKLLKKVNVDSRLNDLSVNETLALCSENHARIFNQKASRVLTVLENHSNWLKKESIYFQWMETVLKERAECDSQI